MKCFNKQLIKIIVVTTVLTSSNSFARAQTCYGPTQIPLTSIELRNIARELGIINDSMSTLTQNRRIGRSFQELVQRSMQYTRENGYAFASPNREAATGGTRKTVRPDFTEAVNYVTSDGVFTDPFGSFVEVKATGAILNPSYYYHQIRGHIDAVSRRPAGRAGRGWARVLFITTSDTTAGPQDTLQLATNSNVAIWKAIVCRLGSNINGFQVGPAVPLNPGIYSPNVPIPGAPGGVTLLSQPGVAPPGYEDAEGGY